MSRMRSRRWLGASLAKSIMIVTTLAKSVAMMMLDRKGRFEAHRLRMMRSWTALQVLPPGFGHPPEVQRA